LAVAKRGNAAKNITWLSESNKFALCKDLEGYHSLWGTSFVRSKQVAKQAKCLEKLLQKYNFSPSYLLQQQNFILFRNDTELRTERTSLARKIKKKMTATSGSSSKR